MQEPKSLLELIDQLPVEESVKQSLREKLKAEGEDAVKADISSIMTQAAELLKQNQQAEGLLPEAVANYQEELTIIDNQAAQLSSAISKDLDEQELGQARQKLS